MSDVDDDIRADFLAEAGELIDNLGHQLVALESRPHDADLLNAIFRAFHTVKGGAGFLGVHALVELCHATEDVFNQLRGGKRSVDAPLMDAVLQAVDRVQAMMADLGAGREPAAAPSELIRGLHDLAAAPAAPATVAAAPKKKSRRKTAAAAPAADPNLIGDDEFEALLDELHGGQAPGQAPGKAAVTPSPDAAGRSGDTITEDEFDALLDQMAAQKKQATTSATTAAGAASLPRTPPDAPAPAIGHPAPAAPAAAPPAAATETTVRVDTGKLDRMMNGVGELVLVRNRLKALAVGAGSELARAVRELDFITRSLQGAVMQVRMQPVGKVFARFPKLARDVARGLGKQVDVVLVGQDTDLDKNLVEALADPLVHMVRNSVDHGIEMPELRIARGKPAAGRIRLEARQEGDHIRISVRDDGAGIDPERIRAKVVEKGLLDSAAAARLSADECLQQIFLPGFSTKDQVSDLSGRGVGMDVVKKAIQALISDLPDRY